MNKTSFLYNNHTNASMGRMVRRRMPGFETEADCLEENKIRVEILLSTGEALKTQFGGELYRNLANQLRKCTPRSLCGSMACSLCQRARRLEFIEKWLPFIEEFQDEYVAITLISYMDMLPNKELLRWKFDAMKERYRKQIERIGFSMPVIGGFEMDYHYYAHDPESSHWMPHFHLLVPNEPDKIRKLRQYVLRDKNLHARNGRKNRPFRMDKISDPLRALSYCITGLWMQYTWFQNQKGDVKKSRKACRIRDNRICAKSLVKLDRMSNTQLTFVVNVHKSCKRN